MKPLWILALIYSGHPGHVDGEYGPQQGIAWSQAECERMAALLTSVYQYPRGERSPTNSRIECNRVEQ